MIRPEEPFTLVLEVATHLSGFPRSWWIAGGWAIDLFLGRVTRPHEDVDVAVLRRDQRELQAHLANWEFEKIVDGRREPWRAGEWLSLPIHELHARRPPACRRTWSSS